MRQKRHFHLLQYASIILNAKQVLMQNSLWYNQQGMCFVLDVDECQVAGDVNGHHCHSNTRCVNVVGGYVCQCLSGYTRRDKFNCVEVLN